MSKHPIQPLELDANGTLRFKENTVVRHLLDNGGIDLNKLACLEFPQEDREQFAQLIGYSLSGFSELSYVSDTTYNLAAAPQPAEFEPIQQPGYEPGEIPHHFSDLTEYAVKLKEQNEAMRDFMARVGMCISLAKARRGMKVDVTISSSLAQRLQERLDPHRDAKDWGELVSAQLGTAKIVCKDCGWPHINTTETCDDATARERGKS